MQARGQRAAEVDELIAGWTREHTKEEAMKIIGEAGVPAGAVFDTLELMNEPTFAERGIMQTIEHPTSGKVKMPAWPVRFDGSPGQGQAVAALGPAQRRGADRLARHERPGGRRAERGRHHRRQIRAGSLRPPLVAPAKAGVQGGRRGVEPWIPACVALARG